MNIIIIIIKKNPSSWAESSNRVVGREKQEASDSVDKDLMAHNRGSVFSKMCCAHIGPDDVFPEITSI